jgi:hypothetical protein
MFDTKKVISKKEQEKIDAERRLKNQEGFIQWLAKMNSTHQANIPRMQRALDNIL